MQTLMIGIQARYACCGSEDCRPVDPDDVRMTEAGYFVMTPRPAYLSEPQQAEWFIPRERAQTSPDDRYHICERLMPFSRTIIPHLKYEKYQKFMATCFFVPMGTGSIQSE